MPRGLVLTFALAGLAIVPVPAQQPPQPLAYGSSCTALAGLGTARTQVIGMLRIPAGDSLSALSIASPTDTAPPFGGLPEFCRLILAFAGMEGGEAEFEAWLPVATWTGRLTLVGTVRGAGPPRYAAMAAALTRGSAAMAIVPPASMVRVPVEVMHDAVTAVKRVIASYYGPAPRWSYWAACGADARDGLELASRFPDDVDGVLAGAPDLAAPAPAVAGFLADQGAIVLHHGIAAGASPPAATTAYLAEHARAGARMRLFVIPGAPACPPANDASAAELMAALSAWVERDVPPDRIVVAGREVTPWPGVTGSAPPTRIDGTHNWSYHYDHVKEAGHGRGHVQGRVSRGAGPGRGHR